MLLLSALVCPHPVAAAPPQLRVMTFNASMNRSSPTGLINELKTTRSSALKRVAEVVQFLDPDILLINEFDNQDDESR